MKLSGIDDRAGRQTHQLAVIHGPIAGSLHDVQFQNQSGKPMRDVGRTQVVLDDVDREILNLLKLNARRTARDIARHVNLTVAPVKRRIDRLEAAGVITGYGARINYTRMRGLEATVELRVASDMPLELIVDQAAKVPEVEEVLCTAGDIDALVRIRADDVRELQRIVGDLRAIGQNGTKTLVIIDSWRREE